MIELNIVSKGPPIQLLDQFFGGPTENYMLHYEEALAKLNSPVPVPLGALAEARVGPEAASHFTQDWLTDWWPEAQPVGPILVQGLIEAITQAQAASLPMNFLWVTAASQDQFEVGISASAVQVTVLFLTPLPPGDPGPGVPDEPTGVTLVLRNGNGDIVTIGS